MSKHIEPLKQAMVDAGRSLFERGLTGGTSGNLSIRVGDEWLVTPTNSCLGELTPSDISHLDGSGRLLAGKPPSKELALHQAFLSLRPDDQAVVHLHSTYGTAWSCLTHPDPGNVLPPLTPYAIMRLGQVALLPYRRPGDPRMAEDITRVAAGHRAVLLANHGPLVAGRDLAAAQSAIEELEATARLALVLRDEHPRLLDHDQIRELETTFGNSNTTGHVSQ
ncbi:aldolase [Marinobacter sp. JSM 1782161]|uniref:3-oxo-tetronate 4-phosphate decarboxylase n=1 Tax=Marinobacter sp. JSM 1782161 TaxID=2685906 RepID=UPI002B1BD279|nr:aldolase [Marinobacter sp. JSM 1782161]